MRMPLFEDRECLANIFEGKYSFDRELDLTRRNKVGQVLQDHGTRPDSAALGLGTHLRCRLKRDDRVEPIGRHAKVDRTSTSSM
jgi:hypothetical protein